MRFWIFEIECYDTNRWKKDFFFYCLSNVLLDLKTDWRFRWVQDKRGKGKLLGTVDDPVFPVQYPILTNEGKLINSPNFDLKKLRSAIEILNEKKPKQSKSTQLPKIKKLAEHSDFKVERPEFLRKQTNGKGLGDFANFKIA